MPESRTKEPEVPPVEEEIDLDLDLEDANLREAIGQPTKIRVGGKIITFPHHAEWTHEQTRLLMSGMFDTWALELLSPADFKAWKAANLKNYQFDGIIKLMLKQMGTASPGKSQPPFRSQQRRRGR
jgi:hypothetical protein